MMRMKEHEMICMRTLHTDRSLLKLVEVRVGDDVESEAIQIRNAEPT